MDKTLASGIIGEDDEVIWDPLWCLTFAQNQEGAFIVNYAKGKPKKCNPSSLLG